MKKGFELAPARLPNLLVQHLTTRPSVALIQKISTYLTRNWDLRKTHFNIQMDKVSRMLETFLEENCFLEAKASLCFAKNRGD